jgi:hypothetical protein
MHSTGGGTLCFAAGDDGRYIDHGCRAADIALRLRAAIRAPNRRKAPLPIQGAELSQQF